jgi:transcriptional regulator of aromatic amino acid metabolism
MAALRAQIRHVASFDPLGSPPCPHPLTPGETGTGKGLVARVIHDSGPRTFAPFIKVNCAAIPESMLEAELFGSEAGTFTAAERAKPGLFAAAHLALGTVHYHLGIFAQAYTHLEQGMVLCDSQKEPSPTLIYARGPKVVCASWSALTLWMLGHTCPLRPASQPRAGQLSLDVKVAA